MTTIGCCVPLMHTFTCPFGQVSLIIYLPQLKLYLPRAGGQCFMLSPVLDHKGYGGLLKINIQIEGMMMGTGSWNMVVPHQ